jgi:hypothetical protein
MMSGKVLWYGLITALGIALLLPGAMLFLHFAALSNIGVSEGEGFSTLGLLSLATVLFGVVYLISLFKIILQQKHPCRWCHYSCIAYATYSGLMIGYLTSGDFAHQLQSSGLMYAISNHLPRLGYIAIAVIFIAVMLANLKATQTAHS